MLTIKTECFTIGPILSFLYTFESEFENGTINEEKQCNENSDTEGQWYYSLFEYICGMYFKAQFYVK